MLITYIPYVCGGIYVSFYWKVFVIQFKILEILFLFLCLLFHLLSGFPTSRSYSFRGLSACIWDTWAGKVLLSKRNQERAMRALEALGTLTWHFALSSCSLLFWTSTHVSDCVSLLTFSTCILNIGVYKEYLLDYPCSPSKQSNLKGLSTFITWSVPSTLLISCLLPRMISVYVTLVFKF
jgi:hypothetical protein